jgi:hypothetical protein
VPEKKKAYNEHLLQWIWKSLRIKLSGLQTLEGLPVSILDPGYHNPTDGPDFIGAKLRIGRMKWYGDVEIHWNERDWYHHRHHLNANYNKVVLHVIYEHDDSRKTAYRQDKTRMHTLQLKPYLSDPLKLFLSSYNRPGILPCSGHISYISNEAFELQLEKARREYFDQKVSDLLRFYDPAQPPSRAWLQMVAVGLFDGLGIAHNRAPMQKLCKSLISDLPEDGTREDYIHQALSLSGISSTGRPDSHSFEWKFKSSRPGNQPEARIRQGAECLWFLRNNPFQQWLNTEPAQSWKQLTEQIKSRPGLGRERAQILYGTVWLPALFMLGNLVESERLRTAAYFEWLSLKPNLPKSLLRPFSAMNIEPDLYRHNLGTIYQLRTYCKPRRCKNCEVFKCAISS